MKRLTEKRDTPLVMSMWPGDSQSLRIYNRLAAIEDILGNEYDLDRLRELVEADREGRCSISPKLICIDEVTTPTPEQYRWMMGRFLKGEQDG